ncbi:MAG TPA: hypothetical protein VFW40_03885 [Capsulimonadaceae bacterium]|nr:hypothetical protein [Capsulimonadaceae bacterium]
MDTTQAASIETEPPAPPAVPPAKASGAGMIALLAVLVYVAFDITLPLIRLPERWHGPIAELMGLALPTMIFMLLQLWLAKALVALRWPNARVTLAAFASIGLWFVVAWFVHVSHGMSLSEMRTVILMKNAGLGFLLTAGLTFFGILLALIIKEPNVLLPIALIAIPIDYVGAMTPLGFTQSIVQHAPQIVSAVSVPVPTMGTMRGGIGIHPIAFIGPGDALFIACFFAAVQRLSLNVRGTFWWMYGLLAVSMVIVLVRDYNIAALVPMGIAVIIANFRSFRFQRSEVFAMIYAAIMIFIVVGAFYEASHHFLFKGHPHGGH